MTTIIRDLVETDLPHYFGNEKYIVCDIQQIIFVPYLILHT